MADIKFDDLPDLTAQHLSNPAQAVPILRQWKQTIQKMIGTIGPNRGKAAWYQALIDNGLIDEGGGIGSGGGDLSPPPAPTGFSVGAALSHVFVSTDPPLFSNGGGYLKTKVYGATYTGSGPLPTFATAVVIDEFTGQFEAVPENPGTEWHLWVTWVSKMDVEGLPAGGTNGLVATTGLDVSSMLDVLTAAALDPSSPYVKTLFRADLFGVAPTVDFYQDTTPTTSIAGKLWFKPSTGVTYRWSGSAWVVFPVTLPFVIATVPITQNGQTAPPGVYIQNGYIANGTITTAMIGLAQIDDALVANLSAAKLIAGSLWVGASAQSSTYIAGSSGWHIDSTGTAEFNTVTVRGTIYASAGTIGGATIASTYVQSSGYTAGSAGWKLDNSAGEVFAAAVKIQNSGASRVFDTTATGTNPVLKIDGAVLIDASGGVTVSNPTFTRILDLTATGTDPVLRIDSAILIDASGNASFGGTLTASNIVDTAQIVPNAVTQVYTDSGAGPTSVPTGSPTTLATATVATNGEAIMIVANAFLSTSGGASTSSLSVYRDAVLLYTDSTNAAGGLKFVYAGIDPAPAGSHTYTIQGTASSAGCNASAYAIGLMQAKR